MVIAAAAALAAGALNAMAGGGTLLLYPALLALGLPAVSANLHCSVALCPGYLGAAYAQREALRTQRSRLLWLAPAALVGGAAGGWLLLHTGERAFRQWVPWLILLASLALAAQNRVRGWLAGREGAAQSRSFALVLMLPLLLAAIYAGYFGAGVSVILLAVLGLACSDGFTQLNALKQALALAANGGAVLLFVARAPVDWSLIGVLAASALIGGFFGGRLAQRLSPAKLRRSVVILGLALAAWYFYRLHGGASS